MTGPIERVVVPLDAASENHTAIDTAALLAARAKAPLHGVFVEDEDLLHFAALPFARQVTTGLGTETLSRADVELQLKAAAERARKELIAAARRHHFKASFEIVRGAAAAALSAVSESDLVVAGTLTRPIAGHFRVETRWWSSVEVTQGPLLLARHPWRVSGSVVVLLRGYGIASARLVEAAAQLATAGDRVLTVISVAATAGKPGFEKWLADRLAGQPVRVQVEIAPAEPEALHRRIAELDCRLLAIVTGEAEGSGDRLRDVAARFACDLLVVR